MHGLPSHVATLIDGVLHVLVQAPRGELVLCDEIALSWRPDVPFEELLACETLLGVEPNLRGRSISP